MSVEWRNIPGYDGFYQINDEGDVRSWRYKGGRSRKPRMLVPFQRKRGERGRARYVKLTDATGGTKDVKVLTLMVDIWLGGCPAGMVPYHKNGDLMAMITALRRSSTGGRRYEHGCKYLAAQAI